MIPFCVGTRVSMSEMLRTEPSSARKQKDRVDSERVFYTLGPSLALVLEVSLPLPDILALKMRTVN